MDQSTYTLSVSVSHWEQITLWGIHNIPLGTTWASLKCTIMNPINQYKFSYKKHAMPALD